MIITIDGPAAAGKGTLSQKLAQKYKLAYFDTGMIYRAVGIDLITKNIDPDNDVQALKSAENMTFSKMMELSKHSEFRSNLGGQAASKVASKTPVRQALLKMQQDFAHNPQFADGQQAQGVVYDGRDTGTVVCPNADIKIFITASPEVRAMRRHKEFLEKGITSDYNEVLAQTKERDLRDSSRASAPLKPANDAIIIDTSDMSIEDVYNNVCQIIDSKKQ
ncbi:MAG: (d)CMP kinase [Alphaproteobacteria bacterium]|nr:(d)CMP kinase [Alphaproteobacteria bacterium]